MKNFNFASLENGLFFSVTAVMSDGSTKKMNGRTGVHRYLANGKDSCTGNPDVLGLYDVKIANYTALAVERITAVRYQGKEVEIFWQSRPAMRVRKAKKKA